MTLPAKKYRSWKTQQRKGYLKLSIVVAGIFTAIFVPFGLIDAYKYIDENPSATIQSILMAFGASLVGGFLIFLKWHFIETKFGRFKS